MSLHWDPSWIHNIDGYTKGGQFLRHASGPSNLASFGRHIGTEVGHRHLKNLTANINDTAPFILFHIPYYGFGKQKRALYKLRDTHWNVEGNALAVESLVKTITEKYIQQ